MRRSRGGPLLEPAEGVAVEDVLRRYDPGVRLLRRGRFVLAGGVVVARRRGGLGVMGDPRVARGIGRHLGGRWIVAPPPPGERDEPLEDMLRVYVPRKLVPAEVAMVLQEVLVGVVIREDPRLGLFWFEDEGSELTVSAWGVESGPPVVGGPHEVLYECGIDDVHGPTVESAEQAWRIAQGCGARWVGCPWIGTGFW